MDKHFNLLPGASSALVDGSSDCTLVIAASSAQECEQWFALAKESISGVPVKNTCLYGEGTYMYTYTYIHLYRYIHTYIIHTYIHTYTHILIYTHTCTCIHVEFVVKQPICVSYGQHSAHDGNTLAVDNVVYQPKVSAIEHQYIYMSL